MNAGRLTLYLLLTAVFAVTVWALVTSQAWLVWRLPGGVPIGNLLAAMGVASLPGLAVLLSTAGSRIRLLAWISLAVSLSWYPVSIALAGNLALNYPGNGDAAFAFAGAVVVLALVALLAAAASAVLRMIRRRGAR